MGIRSQDTNYNKNNFAEFAASKRAARRWMEFEDMIQMSKELVRSNEYNSDFRRQTLRDGETLFINKKTNERFILLEPRMIGAGYEKNLTNTIENLKLQGFGGKITFIAPANRNNSHWVMGCGVLNLDSRKVESEAKIDSFADGRQTDGFSCGVHTMEAAAELINTGLSDYMKLYKSRVDRKNGVKQTTTSATPVKSEEQKNAELLEKLNITEDDQVALALNNIEISSIKEMYALTEGLKSELERVNKTRELLGLKARGQQSKVVTEEAFVKPALPSSASQIDMRFAAKPAARTAVSAPKTSVQSITQKEERENAELLRKLNITEEDQIKLISSGIEISSIKEMYGLTEGLKSDGERIKKTRELLNLDVEKHESRKLSPETQVQQKAKSVVKTPKSVEKPVEVSKDELAKKTKTVKEHQSVLATVALFLISLFELNRFSLLHSRNRLAGRNDRGISI